MFTCSISKRWIILFIIFYFFLVSFLIYFTPLSYSEANILYSNDITIESIIAKFIYKLTNNIIYIRFIFFLASIISLYIFSKIIKKYFITWDKYYNLSLFVYIFVPGIFLSFILINYATFPILLTLLLIYAYEKDIKILIITSLVLLLFTHSAQFVIYIALIITSFKDKRIWVLVLSLVLLIISSFISSYSIGGVPRGHLLQLFGIYSAIFSPLLFLFIIYTVYKMAIQKDRDLLMNIIISSFLLSIILSIRQQIKITDFSVFLVIAIPLSILIFKNGIEVRLKEFRRTYYLVCNIILINILIETIAITIHYPLYKYFSKKVWLIDYNIYKIQENAKKLEKNSKECKKVISKREENLYKYYGILKCK